MSDVYQPSARLYPPDDPYGARPQRQPFAKPADPSALQPWQLLRSGREAGQAAGSGVTIKLRPPGQAPVDPNALPDDWVTPPPKKADEWTELPPWSPPETRQQGDWAALPEWKPRDELPDDWVTPPPDMGTAEKAWRGVLNSATFGTLPAVEGLGAAAGPEWHQTQLAHDFAPVVGAAKMLHSYLAGHPDDQVRRDYEEGRQKAEGEQKEAGKSWAYTTGQVLGGLATPAFGAMKAGGLGARAAAGALGGAVGGGLYGAGSELSAGGGAGDIAGQAVRSGGLGALTGGALGGALGPRAVDLASPGTRAATFAEQTLGAPIPRGLASDSRGLNAATAHLRSVPLVGARIGRSVDEAQRAAGEHLGGISAQMAGGPTERAVSDVAARSGLQGVISGNQAAQDAGYSALRGAIDTTQRFTMPNTDKALDAIMRARQGAGWVDPAQGLAQFRNVAGGADFEGAKRALVDARNAGKPNVMHPGYDAGDFRRLTTAMRQDLRGIVAASAKNDPKEALGLFDAAETNFGRLADQNTTLQKLVDAKGEASIATLLGAAKEKGGNVQLLAQLKQKMNPDEFQVVGGQLLHELGHNPTTNAFSLGKFATDWAKLSPGAKRVLFSPQHLKDIEETANLGTQLKGALRETNVSHTAAPIILLDLARDAAMTGVGIGTGAITLGTLGGMAGGAAAAAPAFLFAHWLSSPAKAASMGAFTRAYRMATAGKPTPARMAAFNLATRNLANNLGIPAQRIIERVAGYSGGGANAQEMQQ